MSEKLSITDQYASYFDNCRPIIYKGVTIQPFLAKDIRLCNYACYCLVLDPIDLDDISLMPLKRLDLILTICDRISKDEIPTDNKIAEKYEMIVSSFKVLLQSVFQGYGFDFQDPDNPTRNRVLTIIEPETQKYQVFGAKEFDEISDLILYHNGVDVSYRNYPPAMRKELERNLQLMQKQNKQKAPSIEKMIDSAFLYINSYETVLSLPVRKFYNLVLNIQKREEYSILMSGAYIVKNVSHWMAGDYNRDPYKSMISTEEETMGKYKNL